ncbi:MAG: hypothetical protein JXA53_11690 [Bacteroidales bacterium]|nr:hypothetical protein [Bacteroidales bacterium]
MRKIRILLLASFFAFFIGQTIKAQDEFGQLGVLAKESPELANDIFGAYLNPYGEMFGVALNSGWYNTSKAHSTLGFDFTITASIVAAPQSATSFNIDNILSKYSGFSATNSQSPTIIGTFGDSDVNTLSWTSSVAGAPKISIDLPDGVDFRYMPMPMYKIGVGLVKKIEIMGRYVPTVSAGDFNVGLWGIGAKWQFSEFLPFVKRVPFFSASVLAGYTQFNTNYGIEFADADGVSFDDQELSLKAKAFTGRLLVGANFPIVNFYAGVGYGKTVTSAGLYGEYSTGINSEGGIDRSSTTVDPLKMDIKADGVDFNAGLRIKMAIVTLHFDYTVGKYQMYSAGLGFSFR